MGGACGTCRKEANVCGVLVSRREGKRPVGRPRLKMRLILKFILKVEYGRRRASAGLM
jgi:hypothetical protein